MMEIKIIDLLNKYANNEKLPKKIKCDGTIWEYVDSMHDWFSHKEKCYMFHEYFKETLLRCLWYEVEIIEESKPKEIGELELVDIQTFKNMSPEERYAVTAREYDKLEEIRQALNYLLKRCNK